MSKTDYQIFSTIDTPKEERRRLRIGDIWSNSAKCLVCGEVIRSCNIHDYVTCSCGNLSVDGGSCYLKRNIREVDKYKELSVCYKDVDNG